MADNNVVDEDKEEVDGLPWKHHPLKRFLFDKFVSGEIPTDYKKAGPADIWNRYCDEDAFEGMKYNAAFKRRLLNLQKDIAEGKTRADADLNAFNIAKKNYPPPICNHRGEPQWNGSAAQAQLKRDMEDNLHFTYKPEDLWELRHCYQEFNLTTFRSHIHQADRTRKYLDTLKKRDKDKQDERVEQVEKKRQAKADKKQRKIDKAAAQAMLDAEKQRKAQEQEAEKQRKAQEKEAEKQRKAQAKEAEKQRKAQAKEAEKQRKAQAKADAKKKRDEDAAKSKAANKKRGAK